MRKYRHLPFIAAVAALLLCVGIELYRILEINAGRFTYMFDDAYIHLALAENIVRGQYGINPGEFSSPSSSILWPFLLAPFTLFAISDWIPLLINSAAAVATLFYSSKILENVLPHNESRRNIILSGVILCTLIPVAAMIDMILTGMEHSLQMLTAVMVLYSIVREQHGDHSSPFAIFSVVVCSLVRYENIVISLAAIGYFWISGRRKVAVIAFTIIAVSVGSFSLFLLSLGLLPLPAPILLKSKNIFALDHSFRSLTVFFTSLRGAVYGCVMMIMLLISLNRRRVIKERALSAGLFFVLATHLIFGNIVSQHESGASLFFNRYFVHVWLYAMLTALLLLGPLIQRTIHQHLRVAAAVIVCIEILIAYRFAIMLSNNVASSHNIYQQHFQMHRFVTEYYKQPVIANDIGYLSYRNDQYVLDLWGLSLYTAATYRLHGSGSSEWMDSLARAKGAELAMIYDQWFPFRPRQWKKIAELSLTDRKVTAWGDRVSLYALTSGADTAAKRLLPSFQESLPDATMLKMY